MQCLRNALFPSQYESLEEAISVTLCIYMDVLSRLATLHGWRVFVHPVPPVLNETRSIVRQFNTALKVQVGSGFNAVGQLYRSGCVPAAIIHM
jgi:hypothetical protein